MSRTKNNPVENKKKNITVDADLVEKISAIANSLEPEFGFRPTVTQAIRHLFHTLEKSAAKGGDK